MSLYPFVRRWSHFKLCFNLGFGAAPGEWDAPVVAYWLDDALALVRATPKSGSRSGCGLGRPPGPSQSAPRSSLPALDAGTSFLVHPILRQRSSLFPDDAMVRPPAPTIRCGKWPGGTTAQERPSIWLVIRADGPGAGLSPSLAVTADMVCRWSLR
jgi:hypothetical protein